MLHQSLYHTYKRFKTLQSHVITALPIVILMPHSACNCRCIMCDIWKDNKNRKQLYEADVEGLLANLQKWGTKQVLMSGGEALLNQHFFTLCQLLKKLKLKITLLSTGLTLKQHATEIVRRVDDVIVSLDGTEELHNRIRNISGAFARLREGIQALKSIMPHYRVTARTVIHRHNFRQWSSIIDTAKQLGVDQISFLPADVSSHAFNRQVLWSTERQEDVLIARDDLPLLEDIIDSLLHNYAFDFQNRFIAESPDKLKKIALYYGAVYGLNEFPYKKCNAPWVSAVIEADGTVRPCFFHKAYGNIHEQSLGAVLNSKQAVAFRQNLDTDADKTCKSCVCSLNLSPLSNPAHS